MYYEYGSGGPGNWEIERETETAGAADPVAADDEKRVRELEKQLAQIESELSQKDNDTYRRQNSAVGWETNAVILCAKGRGAGGVRLAGLSVNWECRRSFFVEM